MSNYWIVHHRKGYRLYKVNSYKIHEIHFITLYMTCIPKKGKYHGDLNFTGTTQNQPLTILIFFLNVSEIANSLNLRLNNERYRIVE